MGALQDIDGFLIAGDAALGDEQPRGTASGGNRMHVKLHDVTSRLTLPSACAQAHGMAPRT
jgi:hypothetical protein